MPVKDCMAKVEMCYVLLTTSEPAFQFSKGQSK